MTEIPIEGCLCCELRAASFTGWLSIVRDGDILKHKGCVLGVFYGKYAIGKCLCSDKVP